MALTCTFFTSSMFARDVFCAAVAGRERITYSNIIGAFNRGVARLELKLCVVEVSMCSTAIPSSLPAALIS